MGKPRYSPRGTPVCRIVSALIADSDSSPAGGVARRAADEQDDHSCEDDEEGSEPEGHGDPTAEPWALWTCGARRCQALFAARLLRATRGRPNASVLVITLLARFTSRTTDFT